MIEEFLFDDIEDHWNDSDDEIDGVYIQARSQDKANHLRKKILSFQAAALAMERMLEFGDDSDIKCKAMRYVLKEILN